MDDEQFINRQYMGTATVLSRLGYYDLVPWSEVKAVIGDYHPERWGLTKGDNELSRRIGKALYAEYVMLVERGSVGDPHYYFEINLINVETGRCFTARVNNRRERNEPKLPKNIGKIAYREVFRDAMGDLVSTAFKKGARRFSGIPDNAGELFAQTPADQERLAGIKKGEERLVDAGIVKNVSRQIDYDKAEKDLSRKGSTGRRMIVYDLDAVGSYRPAALIISEAIREEILNRGRYDIVNREDLQLLMDEMKFQQSGLVDQGQAVKLGKGAGANEIVTGKLGALGQSVVLQSKRTEIETMLNLAIASLRSEPGQEDMLFKRLSEMIDRLLKSR